MGVNSEDPLDLEYMLANCRMLPLNAEIPDGSIIGIFHGINFYSVGNHTDNLSLNLYGAMLLISSQEDYMRPY